jgi:hypothetical protein
VTSSVSFDPLALPTCHSCGDNGILLAFNVRIREAAAIPTHLPDRLEQSADYACCIMKRRMIVGAVLIVLVLYVAQWWTLCQDCGLGELLFPWRMWWGL